jgi:hypothetical protein
MEGLPYLQRDLRVLRSSRGGLAVFGLFAVLSVAVVGIVMATGSMGAFFGPMIFVVMFVFPAVGLGLGTFAIVRHRESGTLRVLFTLPGRRARVVFSAFCARALLVLVGFAGLTLVTIVTGVATGVDWTATAGVLLLGVLPTLAFLSVGIALSTITATQRRSVAASGVAYAVLGAGWHAFFPCSPDWVLRILGAQFGVTPSTDLLQAVLLLAPGNSYFVTTVWPFPGFVSAVASAFGSPVPQPAVALVVMLAWVVLPVGVAAWRIERADVR